MGNSPTMKIPVEYFSKRRGEKAKECRKKKSNRIYKQLKTNS